MKKTWNLKLIGIALIFSACQSASQTPHAAHLPKEITPLPRLAAKANIGFLSFCQNPQAPLEIRHTVQQLLNTIAIQDCQEAWKQLQTFTSLDLTALGIKDLTPLIGMSQLKVLTLSLNHIEDILPLSNLPNLQELFLSDNEIVELTALGELIELKTLDLGKNKIRDIQVLNLLKNLEWLDISENKITDISPLQGQDKIWFLSLAANKIQDLQPLNELKRLQELYLQRNQINSLKPLSELLELIGLDASDNPMQKTRANCPTDAGVGVALREYCSS